MSEQFTDPADAAASGAAPRPSNVADPGGNTDQFRAYVARQEPEPAPSRMPLYIGGGVAALVVLIVIIALIVMAL